MSGKLSILNSILKTTFTRPPIVKDKVFVMTMDNRFSCNPEAIIKEVLVSYPDLKIVWATEDKIDRSEFPSSVKLVKRGSLEMFEEMRSSHIWLDNGLNCVWFFYPKRKGQIYINTWHGSLGIKKLSGNFMWKLRASTCKKKTDYCITNSTFEENVFTTTFWKGVDYLKFGHARNAVLFREELFDSVSSEVKKKLGIPSDRKLILYAPTFRDDGSKIVPPDYKAITEALSARFQGEWTVLVRYHFKDGVSPDSECSVDVSRFPDIRELMIASDIALTDYSSWIYDNVLLKRPGFIYAPDISKYESSRGFYYPLTETPFPISSSTDELVSRIEEFDEEGYQENVSKFLEARGCYEAPDSDKKAAKFISDLCT